MTRVYDDPCGVARALNVVGDRWALLVVRELLLGPKRFSELRRGLPGVSPNVLSQRLDDLAEYGVVRRRHAGPPTSAPVYELTEHGAGLEEVLVALGRWGARRPVASGEDLGPDALWLAMRSTFDAARGPCPDGEFELAVGGDTVTAGLSGGRLTMRRGASTAPRATIAADPATMRAVVFGGRAPSDAVASGDLTVRGDDVAASAFLALFPRPAPVAPDGAWPA